MGEGDGDGLLEMGGIRGGDSEVGVRGSDSGEGGGIGTEEGFEGGDDSGIGVGRLGGVKGGGLGAGGLGV